MQFNDEHLYEVPLPVIEKMYFDTAFVPRKYQELGLHDVKVVDSSDDETAFFVSCDFEMEPSLPLPAFIKKIIGDGRFPVTQTDRWNQTTNQGELEIIVHPFEPVSIHAEMSLEEHPKGAVNRFVWTVECTMPIIGNKLAAFLAKDIQKKSADDHAASVKILADYL